MRRLVLVQLKSFGDCVIACAAAERVVSIDRTNLILLIGNHLRELCEALNPPINRIEIDVGESGVPSIFDVRKNGVVKAARSALMVSNTGEYPRNNGGRNDRNVRNERQLS